MGSLHVSRGPSQPTPRPSPPRVELDPEPLERRHQDQLTPLPHGLPKLVEEEVRGVPAPGRRGGWGGRVGRGGAEPAGSWRRRCRAARQWTGRSGAGAVRGGTTAAARSRRGCRRSHTQDAQFGADHRSYEPEVTVGPAICVEGLQRVWSSPVKPTSSCCGVCLLAQNSFLGSLIHSSDGRRRVAGRHFFPRDQDRTLASVTDSSGLFWGFSGVWS